MQNKNSMAKNYIYNLAYNIILMFVPLITAPFVSRRLGDVNIGIFNFEQAIVNYFVLFGCVGLNVYGQREIAYCGNNIGKRSAVFKELMILRGITLSISAILFSGIAFSSEYPYYYMLFGVEIISALFDVSWFFQGVENFKIQAVRNSLVKIVSVVFVLIFVNTVKDLWIYIIIYTLTSLIGNISMWPYLKDYVVKTDEKVYPLRHLKPTFMLFLPQIATTVYTQLDKTMVGIISEYTEVAYYGQAEKIVKAALTFVTSLGYIMLSRVAVSFAKRDEKKIEEYINNSFRFMFFLGFPVMFGLMAITAGFVPWFFGKGWDDVIPCMMALCPIIFLIGCSNVIGTQYLLPTNQTKKFTISVTSGMVVNLVLNAVLIPIWGSSGAALATVIAEFTVTLIQFIFVRKIFKWRILAHGLKNLFASICMGILVLYMATTYTPCIKNTLIEIAAGAGLYCFFLFGLHDSFFFDIMKKIFSGKKKAKK